MAEWLRQQVSAAGVRGIVLGLSGGIDSAVVARVAQMAVGDNVLGVIMPAHSNPQDAADARLVAETFKLATVTVDLSDPFDALFAAANRAVDALGPQGRAASVDAAKLAHANVKPRLRMATLYFVANRLNYLGCLSESPRCVRPCRAASRTARTRPARPLARRNDADTAGTRARLIQSRLQPEK